MIVYIAGPMRKGLWEDNTRAAINAAIEVLKMGHSPFIPHLYTMVALMDKDWKISTEAYMAMGIEFLERSDVLLRLPGESVGADAEVAFCKEHNITVVDGAHGFAMYLENEWAEGAND